jgi:predicted acyl esterase
MERNQRRDAYQWPPAAREMPLFLAPQTDRARSGQLQTTPFNNKDGFSEFVSDPASPVVNAYDSSGAHDYRKLADRADVLTFDSSALEEAPKNWADQSTHLCFL